MVFSNEKFKKIVRMEVEIAKGSFDGVGNRPSRRRSCNMLSCVYSDFCPAEEVRVRTFIVPGWTSCPDNPGVSRKCVIYGIYDSLKDMYDSGVIGKKLHEFSDNMHDKFSALSVSLKRECDKGVIRKRWYEVCEEARGLYRRSWGESL